jgi:hypothetical protein
MTKKEFTGKSGETWDWEETPEVTEALKQLHDRARRANLKAQDDQLNYDTKNLVKVLRQKTSLKLWSLLLVLL